MTALAAYAQPYDLLLRGGHVIDPKNNIDARMDVAIANRKIAKVAPSIPADQARRAVDVSGFYVTPGLIDIHVHVFASTGKARSYAGDMSVFPDGFTFRSGVTTVADAGTAGHKNFAQFKSQIIDRSRTRVLSFLNIVGAGMDGAVEQDITEMQPEPAGELAKQHPGVIVGIKTAHFAAPSWTAIETAVKAGNIAKIPVMVDFGNNHKERPIRDLFLDKLRPGDIYTHCYSGLREELQEDKLNPAMELGRKRGIIFDVGHGGGSFFWRAAVQAAKEGFWPDSISSDLHIGSMNAGMKDMANIMSKFLALGAPLKDVIRMSTWSPARQIQRTDLGHLTEGAVADVAVLRVDNGKFGFLDSFGYRYEGTRNLVAEMTIRDGAVVWDLNARAADDWQQSGPSPRRQRR